ncbi:hypothetical protein [Labedella endophytica]|uniref:DUF4190 domain-containing protein n=1 Tax=Labedella endophytica TaxID=1523160 RepID=A0A3S1CQF4_9MICO|nr:hypothetical protein [Labedella endophytica]RUQ98929.1 hypothetical protein ELQ94_11370 [Labedella endophytica]
MTAHDGPAPDAAGTSRQPTRAQEPFAPPSVPGFREHHVPPTKPGRHDSQQSWPSADALRFTPHAEAPGREAGVALALAIVGALIGLAVGWGLPLSIVALVLAMRVRRRPGRSRLMATWSIALVLVSAIASGAWLAYSLVVLFG